MSGKTVYSGTKGIAITYTSDYNSNSFSYGDQRKTKPQK